MIDSFVCSPLNDSLSKIAEIEETIKEIQEALDSLKENIQEARKRALFKEKLYLDIWDLNFSPYLHKWLKERGLTKTRDILAEWKKLPYYEGFGKKSYTELKTVLDEIGFSMEELTIPRKKIPYKQAT